MAITDFLAEKEKLESKMDKDPEGLDLLRPIRVNPFIQEKKKVNKKPSDIIYNIIGKVTIVYPPMRLVHAALFLRKHLLAISLGVAVLLGLTMKFLGDGLTKILESMNSWKNQFGEDQFMPGPSSGNFNGTLYKETSAENIVKNKIIVESIKQGVDPNLTLAIAKNESGYKQSARSGAGAIGIFQLMPSTASGMGVDPYSEDGNIQGGIKYIKYLLKKFNGDERKAVAAYNAGPGAVLKYGGVPPYKETKKYVNNVLAHKKKLENERPFLSSGPSIASSGTKFGGYSLDKGVTVSQPVGQVLSELAGTGNVSSGIRAARANDYKNGKLSSRSHPYGNKFDIRMGGASLDQCANTLVHIGENYAVIEIGLECFGPKFDHDQSVANARTIFTKAKAKSSKFANRCNSGDLKIHTDWGWTVGGTGPHFDVLIDPGRVKSSNYNKPKNHNTKPKPKPKNNTPKQQPKPSNTNNKPKVTPKNKSKSGGNSGGGNNSKNVVPSKLTTPAPGYTYKNSRKSKTY